MKDRIIKFIKKFLEIPPTTMISSWHILKAVSDAFEIREEWIGSPSRKKCHVIPRHVYFYLCRKLFAPYITLEAIAKTANRTHTTVLYGIESIERQMRSDPRFSDRINQIINDLE